MDNYDLAKTGVTLERPDTPAPSPASAETTPLERAVAGLEAGQASPHLDDLMDLADSSDRSVAGWAVLYLADYYRGRFHRLVGQCDFDRALYYAQRGKDLGMGADADWRVAVIQLQALVKKYPGMDPSFIISQDFGKLQDQYAAQLLKVIDADNVGAIRAAIEETPPLLRRQLISKPSYYHWAVEFAALKKWAVHPQNTDPYSREKAAGDTLILLREITDDIKRRQEADSVGNGDYVTIPFAQQVKIAEKYGLSPEEKRLVAPFVGEVDHFFSWNSPWPVLATIVYYIAAKPDRDALWLTPLSIGLLAISIPLKQISLGHARSRIFSLAVSLVFFAIAIYLSAKYTYFIRDFAFFVPIGTFLVGHRFRFEYPKKD